MTARTKPVKSWRQIAAEVAQEADPEKRKQMCCELLRAVEAEKCQTNDPFPPATRLTTKTPPVRLRAL